jgi:serine/threonine protein kinase
MLKGSLLGKTYEIPIINFDQIDPSMIRSFDDFKFEFKKKIGVGSFGAVFEGNYFYNDIEYPNIALKKILLNNKKNIISFNNESMIIKNMDPGSKYTTTVHDTFVTKNDNGTYNGYIIMKKLDNNKLFSVIRQLQNESGDMWFNHSKKIMIQLLEDISYIHSKNIIHADLKMDNILYNEQNDRFVLTDFGISCLLVCDNMPRGSFMSMDPSLYATYFFEGVKLKEKADFDSDIYSLGTIFFTLLTGLDFLEEKPFSVQEYIDNFKKNMDRLKTQLEEKNLTLSQSQHIYAMIYEMTNPFQQRKNAEYYLNAMQ